MGTMRHRLDKLERTGPEPADGREREQQRAKIREAAEQSTERSRREGKEPVFEITGDGEVLCARDGRPVEDLRQVLAEEFYWMQVEWHDPDTDQLAHDEEAQAFYTPEGEPALTRTVCHLDRLFRCL